MTYNELKDKILKLIQSRRKVICSHQYEVIDLLRDYFTEELTDVTYLNSDDKLLNAFIETPLRNIAYSVVRNTDCYNKTIEHLANNSDIIPEQVNQILEEVLKESNEYIDSLISRSNYAYLYIRFPKVTVTNEDDKSVDIDELYVLVIIRDNGKLRRYFSMVRSSYPIIQWLSRYSHSHLPKLEPNEVPHFDDPCLGRGPLVNTQDSLECDFDIDMWGLFAFELEKYVTQESLTGGPYIKLESIGKSSKANKIKLCYKDTLDISCDNIDFRDFLISYCNHTNINISYKEGQYNLGITDVNFVISLSDYFIKWYNNKVAEGVYYTALNNLIDRDILNKVIIDGNKVYSDSIINSIDSIQELEGSTLAMEEDSDRDFIFKGNPVKLHIEGNLNIKSENYTLLLNTDICSYMLTKILEVINNKYGTSNQ